MRSLLIGSMIIGPGGVGNHVSRTDTSVSHPFEDELAGEAAAGKALRLAEQVV